MIGTKISNDLVYIKYDNEKDLYSTVIKCPYCSEKITVTRMVNVWNTLNFDDHLSIIHCEGKNKIKSNVLIYQ